jgi:hypothetical protein
MDASYLVPGRHLFHLSTRYWHSMTSRDQFVVFYIYRRLIKSPLSTLGCVELSIDCAPWRQRWTRTAPPIVYTCAGFFKPSFAAKTRESFVVWVFGRDKIRYLMNISRILNYSDGLLMYGSYCCCCPDDKDKSTRQLTRKKVDPDASPTLDENKWERKTQRGCDINTNEVVHLRDLLKKQQVLTEGTGVQIGIDK